MKRSDARRVPHRRQLCLSVLVALGALLPAHAATVTGRVTDASGDIGFKGARVRIVELGRDVASTRDGRFSFDGVAPGRYQLEIEYVGAPAFKQAIDVGSDTTDLGVLHVGADVARLDNILVVGQAAGQASAINQQRSADTMKNVVSADAIGQLPDQNVTEALQRVPGVSITRDQGEGRYVVVRGIDPNLNAVSIGGVRVPGPESDGRQIQLDVIPSELLAAIDVDKTVTPDMDADALGGSIDIKTVSAFDRAGDTLQAKVEGGWNDNADKWSPKGSIGGTRLFDVAGGERNLGVAFAANFNKRHLATDNVEAEDWSEVEAQDGSTGFAPENIEQRKYTSITRTREAYALNLDYQASDSTILHLRSLYSAFKDAEQRQANAYIFDDGEALSAGRDGVLFGEGAHIEKTAKLRTETARIRSYDFGGHTEAGPWTFDYSAAFSSSDEHEPDRIDAVFKGEDMDVGMAGTLRPTPHLYASDPDAAANPENYALDELTIEHNYTHDKERQFRLDVKREFAGATPSWLKFGGKARRREKTGDSNAVTYDGFGDDDVTLANLGLGGIRSPFGAFGPGISPGALRDLVRARGGEFEIDPAATLEDSQGADFRLNENIDAVYLMGGVDLGDVRLVGGVRGERTRFEAFGNRVLIDDEEDLPTIVPQAFSRSYTDWLPNLNLRWSLDDEWLMRAAYTQNVVRANFADLAPAAVVEIEHDDDGEIERKAEFGNPALDPYRSRNLDVSFEWYPGDALGIFTVGAYAKQIRDFVVRADLAGSGDYAAYDEAIVPINGDTAKLRGVEFGWTRRLGDVAPWLDGLLVSANASFSHSEAKLAGRDGDLDLPFQSNRNANLVLGYERSALDLRLAASYIGKRLVLVNDVADPELDVYEQPHFQVDFTAKYRFLPQWKAYLDIANITDRPLRETYRNGLLSRYERYGRTVQVGLEAEF